MTLAEILERIEFHMLHENYDAAEKWRDHLNDMIRWQRVASGIRRTNRELRLAVGA